MLKLTLRCHVEKPKFLFIACIKITDTIHFIIPCCFWSEKCYLVLLMLFSLSEES